MKRTFVAAFFLLTAAGRAGARAVPAFSNAATALEHVDEVCEESEHAARLEFQADLRRIHRSLRALDTGRRDRRAAALEARSRYRRRLADIAAECGAARRDYARRFLEAPMGRPPVETSRETPGRSLRLGGSFIERVAYRIADPNRWRTVRSQLALSMDGPIAGGVTGRLSARGFVDPYLIRQNRDAERNGEPTNSLAHDAEIRDAFVDIPPGDMDLRLGKQTVVWGEAPTLFVADVVNAKDLREFILPDFDWIRRPQWSADATYIAGSFTQELVATVPRFDRLPDPGSDFSIPFTPPPGLAAAVSDPRRPPAALKTTSVGTRLSQMIGSFDLGLFYLYGWDTQPIPFYTLEPGLVRIAPAYRRQHYAGMTFSATVGETVLKGEAVVRPSASLLSVDPAAPNGVYRKTTTDAVIAADHTLGPVDASLQLFERRVSGFRASDHLVNEHAHREHVSLWLRWNTGRRWTPELTAIVGATERDALWRPRLSFQPADHWLVHAGLELFDGRAGRGLFGPYRNQDRATVETEFRF